MYHQCRFSLCYPYFLLPYMNDVMDNMQTYYINVRRLRRCTHSHHSEHLGWFVKYCYCEVFRLALSCICHAITFPWRHMFTGVRLLQLWILEYTQPGTILPKTTFSAYELFQSRLHDGCVATPEYFRSSRVPIFILGFSRLSVLCCECDIYFRFWYGNRLMILN